MTEWDIVTVLAAGLSVHKQEESMVLWFQPVDDNWEIQPDNWGIYVGTEEPPDEIKATKVLWYQID